MRWLFAAVVVMVGAVAQEASAVEPPMCPVMTDEYAEQEYSTEYEGQTVYFCCQKCRLKFETNPDAYTMQLAAVGQAEEVDWSVVEIKLQTPGMSAPTGQSAPAQTGGGGVSGVFGRSHVVWVHFPIACLVIAGVIRLGALIGFEGTKRVLGTSGLLLLIGAFGAVVSAASGLLNPYGESFEQMQGVLHETYERHELLGLVLAGLAIAAVMVEVWSVGKRTGEGSAGGGRNVAHGAVVVCGALAIVVAHLGGTLVHGPGFLMP